MGNNMCAGARQGGGCAQGSDPKTPVAFGMLCGRSYDKPIVIKFQSADVYTSKKRRRKSSKISKR